MSDQLLQPVFRFFRQMNVILFISFLFFALIFVVIISTFYNFNLDEVFNKYQENLLVNNAYKMMDDLRNEQIDLANISEADERWIVRRANLYGILFQLMDEHKRNPLIDTLSSFNRHETSGIHEFPFYKSGNLVGYLRVSTLGATYELNPVVIEFKEQIKYRSQILFISLFIVAIFVSWVISKALSMHIIRLKDHADHIRKGSRTGSILIKGPEEIRQLAITLNDMSSELKKQEDWRQHLMEDIAHELRTPFASMLSQLEAIIDGVYEPSVERIEKVYEELDRLSRLVNDLEDLSEAESARFTLNMKRTHMVRLSKRAFQNFLPMARSKGIKLIFESTNVPCYGEVDRDKIIQVISNMLSNAIKYTPSGGIVTLFVDWNRHSTLIICEDNGIGISNEDLPYIFNRLYRADKSRSRFTGGVGLGLSIVKALIEAHDGTVYVESELGKGTRFTVELPNVYKQLKS